MQLSFIALHLIAESVLKTCVTLRGLGGNSCHLVESPLNFEDKIFSRPLQQY